ncbi:MAG: glycerol kinase GlpK [Chloroflexi bacterium]|nr:glycerol kinase GlpK [Chloroflexota bacterium]
MKDLVLALDQGTTSSRAILFDAAGSQVAVEQQEFPQLFPRPGWVEHDPEAIWSSQIGTARSVLARAGVTPERLAAIGITNQRETTLLWDRRTGAPLSNAIVWQCRRTAPLCDRLKAEGFDSLVRERTGLVLDAYFSGTKLAWLLDNVPQARTRAERGELAFGTVDTFLIWRLTGGRVHVTDVSNASRTLLFDIHKLAWDDDILTRLGIPRSLLPQVRASSEIYGESDPALLGAAIPIAGDAGDQQAALFGQACFQPGMAKNTYGTGCFLLLNTGSEAVPSKQGLLTTVGWQHGPSTAGATTYCLEGSVFIAGAAIQWLRDGLHLVSTSAEIEPLAAAVPDCGGVAFVPAFVGLGAPYWDPYARGTIVGLTRGTTAGHLARAALESIAFQSTDVLEVMASESGRGIESLRVDGGAARNDLLMQFQADMLGRPVQRPVVTETTALGAAYLAGLATGLWVSPGQIASGWKLEREYLPRFSQDERASRLAFWHRAVERSRQWANE